MAAEREVDQLKLIPFGICIMRLIFSRQTQTGVYALPGWMHAPDRGAGNGCSEITKSKQKN
jgi:hypothetical protein